MYTVWDMNEGDGAGRKVHPPGPGPPVKPRERVDLEPWREAMAMLHAYKPSKDNQWLAYILRFHNMEARRLCTKVAYGGWDASGGDDPPKSA